MESYSLVMYNVLLEIEYDYTKGEPEVYNYGDGSGYPGSPAKVDIYTVSVNGADITDIISDSVLEEVREKLLDYHEDN